MKTNVDFEKYTRFSVALGLQFGAALRDILISSGKMHEGDADDLGEILSSLFGILGSNPAMKVEGGRIIAGIGFWEDSDSMSPPFIVPYDHPPMFRLFLNEFAYGIAKYLFDHPEEPFDEIDDAAISEIRNHGVGLL